MKVPERNMLFLLVLSFGGYLIFVWRNVTNNPHLKAPPVYSNIYIVQDNPGSSNMAGDRKDLADLRRKAIQALFVSKNTLSFCKHASSAKSKGKF